MATIVTYEDVNPTLIPNTVMQKKYFDGVFRVYTVTPVSGYVMHDNALDYIDLDGNHVLGYTRSTCTCGWNYDFTANTRGFYAVPETDVPADNIFGASVAPEIM